MRLPLTFACGDYDRTSALADGRVRPEGIDLIYLSLPVEETFFRMLRHREFEVAEMSLSTYVATLAHDEPPFVALPVYTSRMFRHGGVFCHAASGIEKPEDLVGKRVGTPELQLTAGVWIRGILEEHHGVPVDSVTYVTGGQEAPGRVEKGAVRVPFEVEQAPVDRTLSQMLADGEIDALHSPRIPSSYLAGDGRVRRLFADPVRAERLYFDQTGIFPIMHVVVVRRDVYERHRWVARSLTTALEEARELAWQRFHDSSALAYMSPWLVQHAEEDRALLGEDFWSYGVEQNRIVLEAFVRYHHAQGLSPRRVEVEELFAPEATESFVI